MFEILKAVVCICALIGPVIYYELSGKTEIFAGKVWGKQKRCLEGDSDLFVIQVWYECLNGSNLYNLFVSESDFNRLWEDDTVSFEAKKGKLTKWLWDRKLVDNDFGRETLLLS